MQFILMEKTEHKLQLTGVSLKENSEGTLSCVKDQQIVSKVLCVSSKILQYLTRVVAHISCSVISHSDHRRL